MTDSTRSAAPDVRRWPSDPVQLADTTLCPACFSRLLGVTCDVCGLRLDVAAATDLLAAGIRVRDAEADRQSIISRMRAEQARRAVASVPSSAAAGTISPLEVPTAGRPPAAVPSAPTVPASATPSSSSVAPSAPPPPRAGRAPEAAVRDSASSATPPAPPRRSGVQVLLLTLGVVLLSVAAMVFLFFAFVVADLEMRSLIVAVASVVVLGLAWLLRARRLPGTAEGVSAVGAVLLVLDAWIIQANGLFGADRLDSAAYWGIALLVVSAVLAAAGVVGRLRVPRIGAAALAPTGVFLGAFGVVPVGEIAMGLWLGGMASALLAAASRVLRPRVERTIVRSLGFAGGGLAFIGAAWALPELEYGVLWSFLAVAVVWSVVLVAMPTSAAGPSGWRSGSSVAIGLSLPLALVLGIALDAEPATSVWLAPGLAALVAVGSAALTRLRAARHDAGPVLLTASIVSIAAALPSVVIVLDGLAALAGLIAGGGGLWSLPADADVVRGFPDEAAGAVLALAIVTIAIFGVLALTGRLRRFAASVVGLGVATAFAAAVLMPELLAATLGLMVLSAAALAAATIGVVRRLGGAARVVLASGGIPAAVLAWLVAHASPGLWSWVVPSVLVLAIAGRVLANRIWRTAAPVARVLHLIAASLIGLLAAVAFPGWAQAAGIPVAAPWNDPAFLVALLATLALGLLALAPRLPVDDRIALGATLFAGAMIGSTWLAVTLVSPWGWAPATALGLVGLVWTRSEVRPVSSLFAAGTPLAMVFAGAGVAADLEGGNVAIGMAAATLIAAVLAHVALPRGPIGRRVWSIATAALIVVSAAVAISGAVPSATTWVVLLLLAPAPLVLAALFGDPVGGPSATTTASWGTLVLGVGSIWAWCGDRGTVDVEAYTLPLAVGLMIAAGLVTWRRPASDTTAAGRTILFAAAAAVAVLPSTATAGDSELRTLVLVAIGGVLVIAGGFAPELARGVPVRMLVVATGWVAATGAALLRGSEIATGSTSGLPVEFWPVLALAVGVIASVLWARDRAVPASAAELTLAASVALTTVPTMIAIADDIDAELRVAVLLGVLAVVHVLSTASRMRPFAGPALSWTSLGTAVIAGGLALASGTVDPFDLVTVPIGTALVAAGAVRLRRSPGTGSWSTLGPGLAVLLLPALLADWTDPVLWRLVALGVAAVAVVVAGAVLRLQAPLLLGGAVLLVHAIAQLWPWITLLYEAVWWWLWLGIAGALLIVIAATYERQMRLARGVIRTIGSLR